MENKNSFKYFVFKEHRWLLYGAIVVLIIHFVLIKLLYPHAISDIDSRYYVRAADLAINVDMRPIGYSLFLRWIHFFTHKDIAVVIIQFILLECAILYFYFSLLYLLRTGKFIRYLILFGLIMNPMILCINNYVMSDGLFAALTVWWFTLMLWFCCCPKPSQVYAMAMLLICLFAIRYNSMFYPVISATVVLFSKIGWRVKLAGLALGCLLFWGFIRYTTSQYYKLTGQRDFSPFSGWQLAANALLMYRHLPDRKADIPPSYLQPLHQLVLHHLDTAATPDSIPDYILRNYFMWDIRSPLQHYLYMRCPNMDFNSFPSDGGIQTLRGWVSMGKLYREYGAWLIKKHPLAYGQYYISQGLEWFVDSKAEFSNTFDQGGFVVTDRIKRWFGYSSQWVHSTTFKGYTFIVFPFIIGLLNLLLILGTTGFYYCRCHTIVSPIFNWAIALNAVFWLMNFVFLVTLAPMTLRYALPILILNLGFVPVLSERIYHVTVTTQ